MPTPPKRAAESVSSAAPGKVILFGEHAINRGQSALSASIGLWASCRVTAGGEQYCLNGGGRSQSASRAEVTALGERIHACRASDNASGIQQAASEDYFAPAKYVLWSMFGSDLPPGLTVDWQSDLPGSSGMGSGGAAFTALVAAAAALRDERGTTLQRAGWAHRGDIVAHGGTASALDTQTSLLGGVLCYTGASLASAVPCAPGLTLVIGHSGVDASTGLVNSRVRRWLVERPVARLAPFNGIGALVQAALPALATGDWDTVGRLMTLNQYALEKIGVSCPELETLIDASLEAGAFGAKVSGSGGGGIMVALVSPETQHAVAEALSASGGTVYTPDIGVRGVHIQQKETL